MVDFGVLGGGIRVGCAAGSPSNGVDALRGAGFSVAVGAAAKHGTIDVALVVADVDPNTLEPIAEVVRDGTIEFDAGAAGL